METDYFNILSGVLQGDTLAPYLFIICLDYVLWTSIDKMKENGFKLTKERSRKYPAQTITDGSSLKLIDKFTYLGSSFSSTEAVINTRLAKALTAIDRLSVI